MASEVKNQETQGLGLFDAVSIIVGIVIGTTIFKVPWLIFDKSSDPWMGLTVWLVGGILAFVGALCYAELATAYPRSGGDYFYLTRAFGPWMGFMFGWAQLIVVFTASIGAMAFVFGEFATQLQHLNDVVDLQELEQQSGGMGLTSEFLYASAAVIVLTLLNMLGVVFGKLTQNLLTLTKIIAIGAILVAGFGWVQVPPTEWKFAADQNIGWASLAMILVFYAYGGWNDAAFVAAEVRRPQKNIPRALLIGVGLITVVYLLINAAYLTGLGFEDARRFPAPGVLPPVPARLLEQAFPGWGGKGMSILVMISALGAVNGLTFTGARIYATLGNDYSLFAWLGLWRPGKRAPVLALLFQAIVTLGMIFMLGTARGHEWINRLLNSIGIIHESNWKPGDAFETLFSHAAPVFWVLFMLTGFSLLLLRSKDAGVVRPFSVPLYPWLPIIFCETCGFMLYQSTIYVGWRSLFAIGLVLLGIPLYWLACLFGGYHGDATKTVS